MQVTQTSIDQYVTLKAKADKIKEELDELRPAIVKYLMKHECPNGGRCLIELIEAECKEFKWKAFAISLARKLWHKDALRKIAAAKASAKPVTEYKLLIKTNPDWRKTK